MGFDDTSNAKHRNGNRSTRQHGRTRLRIMITNGRFPVALEFCRQFSKAGHTVFCVDPMRYHLVKFSNAASRSKRVPAPHDDPINYIEAVKYYAIKWQIDMIIPIHEEILYLAGSGEEEIVARLFAPSFELMVRLQHKYEFSRLMQRVGLGVPEAYLCRSMHDVLNLPVDKYPHGMALTPCLGRKSKELLHLKPGEPVPNDLDIGNHNHYIAQEWLVGDRYCSYSVVRDGQVEATGLYHVLETVDGHSSALFQQKFHAGIYDYIRSFVSAIPAFSGQIAFDFIETAEGIWAVECNPSATSGVHLWKDTTHLVRAITGTLPKEEIERPIRPPRKMLGHQPHFHVAAGLLRWKHEEAGLKAYVQHMRRLLFTKDVIFQWRDPLPTIAQPFLLTQYYRMCRRHKMQLPALFQQQLVWEPRGPEWEAIQMMLGKSEGEDDEYYDCVEDHEDDDDDTET